VKFRNAVAAICAGILVALAPAAVADAATGSYQVSTCDYANGINNSWVFQTNDPTHYASHSNCPYRTGGNGGTTDQEGGLSSTDALGASSGAPPGTSAGWTFTAPTGTTITAIDYARYLGQTDDTSNYWVPALLADGTIVPGETCTVLFPDVGCGLGTPPPLSGSDTVNITGLSASQLELGEQCEAPVDQICVTGATTEHEVWAAIYGATVTLTDSTPPTLDTPSGALWGTGPANGYHQGSEAVTASAQDVGGGVASIVLAVDGQTVATYQANCDYTLPQPCPLSTGPQTLTLPTTQLTDGTHTVALAVYDTAGNKSTLASEQINVDNTAPAAPVGLTATPTVPGGSTFNLSWTNPPGQVAPITSATYQVCPASGGGACAQPASTTNPTQGTVTVPGSGSWRIALWLTDAAGNTDPASAADTTVTVAIAGGGGGGSTGPTGPSGTTGPTTGSTGSTGSTGTTGTAGAKPRTSPVHLSERLEGRRLTVTVEASRSENVEVSYTARWHGRLLTRRQRAVRVRHGEASTVFVLSQTAARSAKVKVMARTTGQPAVSSTLKRTVAH
jgi:hypothetical protein